MIFVGSLMKNFFEEFAWRSYLTPSVGCSKGSSVTELFPFHRQHFVDVLASTLLLLLP